MSYGNSKFLKYKLIHYYWNKTSLEFINIGIICYDEKNFKYKIIDASFVENIRCNFLKKKIFKNTILYLIDILHSSSNINELNKKSLYFDNFKFSNEFLSKYYDFDEELNSLFEQYVLYKFHTPKYSNQRKEIIKKIKDASINIIHKSFKNYITIIEDKKLNSFDLTIKLNNKRRKDFLSFVYGSLRNTDDVSKALKAEMSIYENPYNYDFYFASIYPIEANNKKDAFSKQLLEKISYKISDFSSEDKVYKTFEEIVK